MEKHPGIRIDKIPVRGWVGLFFVLGILTISIIATPITRWFFLISIAGGLILAAILYLWRKRG